MRRGKRMLEELEQDIRDHIERETQDNIDRGMSPDEAHHAALLKFGNVTRVREDTREVWNFVWFEQLAQDIRYTLRMLRKSPGFTAVVVLTLALGIGANTAIFSVVEGVVLSPLHYFEPDRLVLVWESNPRFPHVYISYPNFQDWRRTARSFERMAALQGQGYDLTTPGAPEHVDGKAITSGFFATLGVKLAQGREFTVQEDIEGGAPVVIISDRLRRARFEGAPDTVGRLVTLNGINYTIVGVAPPNFQFDGDTDLYTPLGQSDPVALNVRSSHSGILSVARLKSGVSLSQARAEMMTIQKHLDELYPDDDRDLGADVAPLKHEIVGEVSGMLLLLLGAVGSVLLIVCANVANLLLARSTARSREFAIRATLGANRTRLVRQLLAESVVLSVAGGCLGLALAALGIRPLLAGLPAGLPRSQDVALNVPVLLFALGAAVGVGILFGLAPALKNSKTDLQEALKKGSLGSSSGQHRVQSTLVIVQMALTLVLLVGAGLLLRTIRHLGDVNAGFDTQRIITFKVGVSHSLTRTPASTRTAYQQLIERIRSVPGVQAADFTGAVPLSGESAIMPFWIGSDKPASLQAAPRLMMFLTGPDYLKTMGIPLLRGRFFTTEDTTKSPCVMVIDSVLAEKYFPHGNPIGETLSAGFASVGPCAIVGVVGHVRHWGLDEPDVSTRAQAYFPLYQDPDPWVLANYPYTTIVVRTGVEPLSLMPSIEAAVHKAGGDQPVYQVQTMQDIVSASMESQRFPMVLLGAFAGLALLLASIGIYGVISYSVAQRAREIGIRMVLGASKGNVFRMVIGQGLRLASAGLAIGILSALILTRLLSSFSRLLYGVRADDPATFVTVLLVSTGVVILACYVPAYRATRVDPMVPLRSE